VYASASLWLAEGKKLRGEDIEIDYDVEILVSRVN